MRPILCLALLATNFAWGQEAQQTTFSPKLNIKFGATEEAVVHFPILPPLKKKYGIRSVFEEGTRGGNCEGLYCPPSYTVGSGDVAFSEKVFPEMEVSIGATHRATNGVNVDGLEVSFRTLVVQQLDPIKPKKVTDSRMLDFQVVADIYGSNRADGGKSVDLRKFLFTFLNKTNYLGSPIQFNVNAMTIYYEKFDPKVSILDFEWVNIGGIYHPTPRYSPIRVAISGRVGVTLGSIVSNPIADDSDLADQMEITERAKINDENCATCRPELGIFGGTAELKAEFDFAHRAYLMIKQDKRYSSMPEPGRSSEDENFTMNRSTVYAAVPIARDSRFQIVGSFEAFDLKSNHLTYRTDGGATKKQNPYFTFPSYKGSQRKWFIGGTYLFGGKRKPR